MVVDNVREFLENGNVTQVRELPRDGAAPNAAASRRHSAQERAEHGRRRSSTALGGAGHQHRGHAEPLARRALVHARRSRCAAERLRRSRGFAASTEFCPCAYCRSSTPDAPRTAMSKASAAVETQEQVERSSASQSPRRQRRRRAGRVARQDRRASTSASSA